MKKIAIIVLGLVVGVQAAMAYYQDNSYMYNSYTYNNCYNISRNIKRGDRDYSYSDDVAKLQNALAYKGYFTGQITGYFGYVTQSAVIGFQRDNGISTTGYVGPQTRSAIYNMSCNGGSVTPTPIVCTAEARLCNDGSMMPRDADCTWHADRCPASNNYNNGNVISTCPINTYVYNNSCVCPSGYVAQYNINGAYNNGFVCSQSTSTTVCPLNTTLYSSNNCNCPSGYFAQYNNNYTSGSFVCALNQNSNNNNYNYNNNNICSVNTSIYIGVNCTCPAGSVMQYNSNSVLTGNTTFTCNSNSSNGGNVTLSPSSLPATVYAVDQYSNKPLQGFQFSVSNSNTYNSLANMTLSLVNSNLSGASITKTDCNRNSASGALYFNSYDPVTLIYCPNSNIFVSVNTTNMVNGQNYYFTVRVNSGGLNTDASYSFIYNANQSSGAYCPTGQSFLDSSYSGCSCPSGYSKIRSYDVIGLSSIVYKCN